MLRKFVALAVFLIGGASAQLLTPVWVELGEGNTRIARVVVASNTACPSIEIDDRAQPMALRGTPPAGFVPACEAQIPATARQARVNGITLALPKTNPSRILVFGDTGCRIKGEQIQNCHDPEQWPFLKVAGSAAAEKPDLMIHVGDYLYREDPCPAANASFCKDTPSGDNWTTWSEDFFTPAARLLKASPWIFVRGNHEDCDRAWRGWFYYLDPHPWVAAACEGYQPPYTVAVGSLPVVVFDSSSVGGKMTAAQIDRYAHELSTLRVEHALLASHHPFWGFSTSDGAVPSSPGLITAWQKARLNGIDLLLGGHVHLFELLSFDIYLPPQLVAGQGGTDLAQPIEKPVEGLSLGPAKVTAGATADEFGYTLLTRSGEDWSVRLHNAAGQTVKDCQVRDHQVSCVAP